MLGQLISYPQNIFRFIWPVHVHPKTDNVDLKKTPVNFFFFLHPFLQSTYQVDMKNVVECQKEFISYFNALDTYGCPLVTFNLQVFLDHQNMFFFFSQQVRTIFGTKYQGTNLVLMFKRRGKTHSCWNVNVSITNSTIR